MLWRCWLGGKKGIRPVKTERWGAGVVICLEQGADLHMAELMPLPLTVSCFSKIQFGFTSLVPAYPGSPGKRAFKRVCVCVCVFVYLYFPVLFCLSVSVKWLALKCEDRLWMTYIVSRGALNSTPINQLLQPTKDTQ